MPTLDQYRQELLRRANPSLGRVAAITSLTTTTMTVATLADGRSNTTFANKWLLRPTAASQPADRLRLNTSYVSSTGVLTQAGANYTDVTATSESVEILDYEPAIFDNAIQTSIQGIRYDRRLELPTRQSASRYYLGDASWLINPSMVDRVTLSRCPVLTRNREFKDWSTVDTGGLLRPDWWAWSGTAADVSRDTVHARRGSYSIKLALAGTLSQEVGLLETGIVDTTGNSLRGVNITIVGVGWCADAATLTFTIGDGTQTVTTSAHTGGSSLEELTATITVASTATKLTLNAVVGAAHAAWVTDLYAVETSRFGDSVRLNSYDWMESEPFRPQFDQSGEMAIILPREGRGQNYYLYTRRPYPGFDATRLAGGLADADTSDAPMDTVVAGALAHLYKNLAGQQGVDGAKWEAAGMKWTDIYNRLRRDNLYVPEGERGGLNLPVYAGVPARQWAGRWRR